MMSGTSGSAVLDARDEPREREPIAAEHAPDQVHRLEADRDDAEVGTHAPILADSPRRRPRRDRSRSAGVSFLCRSGGAARVCCSIHVTHRIPVGGPRARAALVGLVSLLLLVPTAASPYDTRSLTAIVTQVVDGDTIYVRRRRANREGPLYRDGHARDQAPGQRRGAGRRAGDRPQPPPRDGQDRPARARRAGARPLPAAARLRVRGGPHGQCGAGQARLRPRHDGAAQRGPREPLREPRAAGARSRPRPLGRAAKGAIARWRARPGAQSRYASRPAFARRLAGPSRPRRLPPGPVAREARLRGTLPASVRAARANRGRSRASAPRSTCRPPRSARRRAVPP